MGLPEEKLSEAGFSQPQLQTFRAAKVQYTFKKLHLNFIFLHFYYDFFVCLCALDNAVLTFPTTVLVSLTTFCICSRLYDLYKSFHVCQSVL